jgi:hypothetical protein
MRVHRGTSSYFLRIGLFPTTSNYYSIDASAFAFQACDVVFRDGSAGPRYWFCDVVRVLDAFAETTLHEIRSYRERTGLVNQSFINDKTLEFNENVIGNSHIFRTRYSFMDVFCDRLMKELCQNSNVKGVEFIKCFS